MVQDPMLGGPTFLLPILVTNPHSSVNRTLLRLAMPLTDDTSSSRNYVKIIKFVSSYMKI